MRAMACLAAILTAAAAPGCEDAASCDDPNACATPDAPPARDAPPTPVSPAAPDWVNLLAAGEWVAVGSTNQLVDVDPEQDPAVNPAFPDEAPWHQNSGQGCVIGCWNGGAFASGVGSHGALLVWGGGHAGYSGNEIYAFDMASRTWRRASDPYAGTNPPDPDGANEDGSPAPPHTGDSVEYSPVTNSFFTFRAVSDNRDSSLGANVTRAYAYSFTAGTWRRTPSYADLDLNMYSSGSAYDPTRQVFWLLGNGNYGDAFVELDPKVVNPDDSVGAYVKHSSEGAGTYASGEVDPVNDLYLTLANSNSAMRVRMIKLATPSMALVNLTETGDVPPEKHAQAGWSWSPRRGAVIYWGANSNLVYEAKYVGDNTIAWTRLSVAGTTAAPPAMTSGAPNDNKRIHSRFRVASYEDVDVAVVINGIDQDVWAFKLP